MKSSHLLTLTTAVLLATGSAFAGPNCKKNCPKDGPADSAEEGIFEVVEREGGEAREGKRERGERAEGDRKRPERRDRNPLQGLDLSEEQQEQVKEIMAAARESAKEIMTEARAAKEAGEEVDRKALREQMMGIRTSAMENVYENVLTDDQRVTVDERRKEMEERRAEREKNAKDGERPERKGKGERKDKGGNEGLDL